MIKNVRILLVAALAAVLVGGAFCLHKHEAPQTTRAQFIASTLEPLATLLKDHQSLLKELQAEPFTESGTGILQSYLAKIRRDGMANNAQMKQRLDALAENNTAIVTLIKAYSSQAKTPAFTIEADKFRNYASAWRDRWNSLMELFMAGGNYPASEIPFPNDFPESIQTELLAAR